MPTATPRQSAPRRFGTLRLVPRIMLFSLFGVALLGACVTSVAWYVLVEGADKAAKERVETNMRVAWDVLRSAGKTFSVVDGKLLADRHVLNDDATVVDKVKTLVGGTSTVFLGDVRISTNVMKPDGARAVGTKLARTAAYESVIDRKTPFRGEVQILDASYMTAYDPILAADGQLLGILYVGIKKAEFMQTATSTLWTIIYATLAVAIFVMAASYFATCASVARPLKASIDAMKRLAEGDLTVDTPLARRNDEIGEIMTAMAVFKTNGLEIERLKGERQAAEDRAGAQRKSDMGRLASDFEGTIGNIVRTVASASAELEGSATTLSDTAARAQQQTSLVAAASDEASSNVQMVASATEEMASSVNEISRQVQESSRIAHAAVDQARNTNDRVAELANAASRIGDVVELINTIASQTNLLALNATIEAARAGEAGRGFAVVASEVKALAEQTAKATGEIGNQITGIQAATQQSVGAIKEIGDTIGRMSEISSTIAAAVEEQGAATREISRNVQQASLATMDVTSNIADVRHGAGEIGSASSQVLTAAQSLSSESSRLKQEVGRFLDSVRAA